jgi:hypothetical protein
MMTMIEREKRGDIEIGIGIIPSIMKDIIYSR